VSTFDIFSSSRSDRFNIGLAAGLSAGAQSGEGDIGSPQDCATNLEIGRRPMTRQGARPDNGIIHRAGHRHIPIEGSVKLAYARSIVGHAQAWLAQFGWPRTHIATVVEILNGSARR
jgi:hypothetical protein